MPHQAGRTMSKLPPAKLQRPLLRQAALDRRVLDRMREKGEPFTVEQFCRLMAEVLREP